MPDAAIVQACILGRGHVFPGFAAVEHCQALGPLGSPPLTSICQAMKLSRSKP